jgi:CubicO group peptidase (beta-lactamase class C family)
MTAMCALVLADRGELDFHASVARYWPEFKAAGKESIEVRHLLGHTAGLAGWTEPLAPEDLADGEKCTALLAAQEPWWPERTQSGSTERDRPGAWTSGYESGCAASAGIR